MTDPHYHHQRAVRLLTWTALLIFGTITVIRICREPRPITGP
jgi:hypothetical protein